MLSRRDQPFPAEDLRRCSDQAEKAVPGRPVAGRHAKGHARGPVTLTSAGMFSETGARAIPKWTLEEDTRETISVYDNATKGTGKRRAAAPARSPRRKYPSYVVSASRFELPPDTRTKSATRGPFMDREGSSSVRGKEREYVRHGRGREKERRRGGRLVNLRGPDGKGDAIWTQGAMGNTHEHSREKEEERRGGRSFVVVTERKMGPSICLRVTGPSQNAQPGRR